jgi:acyl carrier protein
MLGSWNLYQLVKNKPGRLFISFASVNGFFGGVGVSAYAAANSFLTALTDFQQARDSLDSYCFSWSMWDELGMSRHYQLKELSRKRGYHSIPAQQGLSSFLAALIHRQTQLHVGLDGANPRIRPRTELKPYSLQKLTAYYTVRDGSRATALLIKPEIRDRFGRLSQADFVQLEQMPLLETGEVDRSQLRALASQGTQRSPARVSPQTETERLLVHIWQTVLNVPEVGIHDNFFELGGDSLLATQIVAQLQSKLQIDLPLRNFLEQPTVAGAAKYIELVAQLTQPASPPGPTPSARERVEF